MQLPRAVRAAVGLAAIAADEARRLPERAIELPMMALSSALQTSLRVQQRYARLMARGDEVLQRAHPSDEPPAWATFDEPVSGHRLREAAEHAGSREAGDPPSDNPPEPPPVVRPVTRRSATPRRSAAPKKISTPRHTKPSAFDEAE